MAILKLVRLVLVSECQSTLMIIVEDVEDGDSEAFEALLLHDVSIII